MAINHTNYLKPHNPLLGGGVTGNTVEADAVVAMWAKKIVKIDVLQSAEPRPSVIAGNKLSQRRRGKARQDTTADSARQTRHRRPPHCSLSDESSDSSKRWNKGPGGRKSSELGEESKEAGEEPEGPPSKSKSANFFANEAALGYAEGAVDSEESCLEEYREVDVLGSPFWKPFINMGGSDQRGARGAS